jgi:hypothetical protein
MVLPKAGAGVSFLAAPPHWLHRWQSVLPDGIAGSELGPATPAIPALDIHLPAYEMGERQRRPPAPTVVACGTCSALGSMSGLAVMGCPGLDGHVCSHMQHSGETFSGYRLPLHAVKRSHSMVPCPSSTRDPQPGSFLFPGAGP